MTGMEIKRTTNTAINVKTQAAGNRLDVDHFLWMARELQKAVEAGMPISTEVVIRNESGVSGVSISARAVLVQEIP